jgi:hypothetical protein
MMANDTISLDTSALSYYHLNHRKKIARFSQWSKPRSSILGNPYTIHAANNTGSRNFTDWTSISGAHRRWLRSFYENRWKIAYRNDAPYANAFNADCQNARLLSRGYHDVQRQYDGQTRYHNMRLDAFNRNEAVMRQRNPRAMFAAASDLLNLENQLADIAGEYVLLFSVVHSQCFVLLVWLFWSWMVTNRVYKSGQLAYTVLTTIWALPG